MALSPAALAGIYHALMGMPPQAETAAALPTTHTMETLQQQAMLQHMASQAGVALPTAEQLQAQAMQIQMQSAMAMAGGLHLQMQQQSLGMAGGPANAAAASQGIPPMYDVLGDFIGQIHAFNEEKGFGFVTCDELKVQGQRKDPFLLRSQLNGCKLGDHINFKAVVNEKGQLQAWGLQYIQDGTPPTAQEKAIALAQEKAGLKRTADEAGFPDPSASFPDPSASFAFPLEAGLPDPIASFALGVQFAKDNPDAIASFALPDLNESAAEVPGAKKPGKLWLEAKAQETANEGAPKEDPAVERWKDCGWQDPSSTAPEDQLKWVQSGWQDPAESGVDAKEKWKESGWTQW